MRFFGDAFKGFRVRYKLLENILRATSEYTGPAVTPGFIFTPNLPKAYIEQNINNDLTYNQRLDELYRETARDIEKEIVAQYMRYANKEGLTMAEARQKVSKMDVEAFAKKAKEYVKNKDFSKEANEQLRAYNLRMRVSRLELMQRTIELELLRLNEEEEAMLHNRLKQSYMDELERQAGILGLNKAERKAVMRKADFIVNGDFQTAPFSDRIWTNNRELAARLRVGLERSIIRGEHPTKWAKTLQVALVKEMGNTGKGNALYKAKRLAITETARVQTQAAKQSFEAAGFEQYIWIAETDSKTCPVCGAMDDRVFSVKGSVIGGNLPPLHPFCRCSVAAYVDEKEHQRWLDEIEAEDLAEKHLERVRNIEVKVTNDLTGLSKKHNGELKGLEYRLKSKTRLIEKILTDANNLNISISKADSKINDVLRYTIQLNENHFTNKTLDILEGLKNLSYNVRRVKNTFVDGAVYKGINTVVEQRNGECFELQFHTPESLKVKENELHVLYEEQRVLDENTKREEIEKLKQKMINVSNKVKNPIGVENIR